MVQRFTILLTILSAFAISTCLLPRSLGQMPMGDPPPMANRSTPEQELKSLGKLLKLSDEQKTKVFPILQRRTEAIEKLIADQDTSMRDKFPKIIALRDHSNDEIRTLLTDVQRQKFDRKIAAEKRRMESGPEDAPLPGDAPPPPQ